MADQLGKYTVIRRLGAGGMAEVFLCRQVGIGGFEKQVVLKRIRADIATDSEFITMFFDEARLAANLNHPNIIQLFEVDQIDNTPYIAMEYVKGATLAQLLQKLRAERRTIDFGHVAVIFAGVCAGLDHAHNASDANGRALNIVHRDISPQNIIVSLDGTAKIFDFGVAKARGSLALTGHDRIKGKFAYMAPEQLRAKPVDASADVYAVGVCLYEATTGKRPFTGGTEGELFAARMDGRFRRPSDLVDGFPTELEEMILAAMSADPDARPTSSELSARLARFCASGIYTSNASSVASWTRGLCSDDSDAYESFSSSPTLTPVPTTASPIGNALTSATPHTRPRPRRRGAVALVAGLVVVAAGAAAAVALGVIGPRSHGESTLETTGPAVTAAVTTRTSDASLRTYLDEAQQNVDAKRYKLAAKALDDASALETQDAELKVKRERLRHLVTVETIRIKAHEALDAGNWNDAIELATQLLDEDTDDADGRQVVAEAKRKQAVQAVGAGVRTATLTVGREAIVPAGSRKATVQRETRRSERAPTRVAMATGSASMPIKEPARAGSGSAGSGSAGSGSAMPRAGSGSAGSAGSASTVVVAPAPARPAVAPAPASTVNVIGSLDAMPSISKVVVDGSLTTSEVESGIGRTLDAVRGCYRAAAAKANRTPELAVRLSFEIDEGARAGRVRVTGDTLGVSACVANSVSSVRTRVAPDIGTVSVTAVLRFKPIVR